MIITLVEKDGGKVYPYQFECTPFFFFHTINAFDKNNDTIVVDIMAYKNADVSSDLGHFQLVNIYKGCYRSHDLL